MYSQFSDNQPINILLIEDNAGDVILAREALNESRINHNLFHVEDEPHALDFLFRRGIYLYAPQPDLILLDLHLTEDDGQQVMACIKSDERLRKIPVVVLSISRHEKVIEESYNLNANCCVTEPLDINEFIQVFETIQNFWVKSKIAGLAIS
jgi:two-component system response regulator